MTQYPVERIQQAVRKYIQACNDGDAAAIASHFLPEAVHYRPGVPKWAGATAIGENFSKVVSESGRWWTVDQILTDAARCEAVLEWTRFDPSTGRVLRGVDWFVFEPKTLLIQEIRPYTASGPDPTAARQEQHDFDYAGRGYPTGFPARK